MKKSKFYITCRHNNKLEAIPKEGYCETLIDDEGHTIDFTLYYFKGSEEPKWILSEKNNRYGHLFWQDAKRSNRSFAEKIS